MKYLPTSRKDLIVVGIIITTVLVAGLVAYITQKKAYENNTTTIRDAEVGGAAYTDLDGRSVSLSEYDDIPLIVHSWASWSPLSRNELQLLAQLKSELGDEIAIVAINRNEAVPQARAYIDSLEGDMTGIQFILDSEDVFYDRIDGYAMPETIVYNSRGEQVQHIRGTVRYEELVVTLKELIQEETLW